MQKSFVEKTKTSAFTVRWMIVLNYFFNFQDWHELESRNVSDKQTMSNF